MQRWENNFSFDGLLPAPFECTSHTTRLSLKKRTEPRNLKRYRRVNLESSRVFTRAVQQVAGWEAKLHRFSSSALVPAS